MSLIHLAGVAREQRLAIASPPVDHLIGGQTGAHIRQNIDLDRVFAQAPPFAMIHVCICRELTENG
jgi:hypothetical protein